MEFVEDKGNGGSNPLMAMANGFAKDRTSWQAQFRAQEMSGPRPPMTRDMQEREMMERFLHEQRGGGGGGGGSFVDPRSMPPEAFNQFIHQSMSGRPMTNDMLNEFRNFNLTPTQERQLRERSRNFAGHFGEMGEQRHQAFLHQMNLNAPPPPSLSGEGQRQWIQQFNSEVQRDQSDFQNAWNRVQHRPPPSQSQQWSGAFVEEQKVASQGANTMRDEFLQQEGMKEGMGKEWAKQLDAEEEAMWERKWAEQQNAPGNWAQQFNDEVDEEELMKHYQQVWEQAQARNDPNHYIFDPSNPYLNDPEAFSKGVQLFDEGHLPEAIKALEAAVQQDTSNVVAWTKLGQAQAENDKDEFAINALSEAVARDPSHLEALASLAVSHTNEFHLEKTVRTLFQWVQNNPAYKHIAPQNPFVPMDEHGNLTIMEKILIDCAKSQREIDPDVHVALGLIYNLSFEYDKAITCFKAALTVRADDYALWNKLGATTANSSYGKDKTPEAIDAYFRALEKKPTYTRARANLGISFMSAQDYVESAKCFLGAIAINDSPHLWDSLRTVFSMMERPDLVDKCRQGNVEPFRTDFNF